MSNKKFRFKVCRPDMSGDSCVATFDPEVDNSIEVAEQAIEDFWNECIDKHGIGTVFGRLGDANEHTAMKRGESVVPYTDVLLINPIASG